jgi:uncharacterized protein
MTSPALPPADRTLRVADLIDRPGASRRIDLSLDVPDDLDLEIATPAGPLRLTGVVESVVEGLLVRGTLTAPLTVSCARCLRLLATEVSSEVTELFTDPARAVDAADVEAGYEIRDAELDLDTLLRDALVPAVPYRPLCDEACKGLCPTCGKGLNEGDCDCTDIEVDTRWTALQALRLPEGE